LVAVSLVLRAWALEPIEEPGQGQGAFCALQTSTGRHYKNNNLVELVNKALSPIQTELNQQLDMSMPNPLADVYKATYNNLPKIKIPGPVPCSVKPEVTVKVNNLLGLNSIWISEFEATKAKSDGTSAKTTVDMKAHFNQSLVANVTLKPQASVCHVPKAFYFYALLEMSSGKFSSSVDVQVDTLSQKVDKAKASDSNFTEGDFALNCVGSPSTTCESIVAGLFSELKEDVNKHSAAMIQDAINAKLKSLVN